METGVDNSGLNLLWPCAHMIQLFYNEREQYRFSSLYNDISVLCKLNNIVVTFC